MCLANSRADASAISSAWVSFFYILLTAYLLAYYICSPPSSSCFKSASSRSNLNSLSILCISRSYLDDLLLVLLLLLLAALKPTLLSDLISDYYCSSIYDDYSSVFCLRRVLFLLLGIYKLFSLSSRLLSIPLLRLLDAAAELLLILLLLTFTRDYDLS